MPTTTYADLAWEPYGRVPAELGVYYAPACDYVLSKLEEQDIDIDASVAPEDLTSAQAMLRNLFHQAIRHKRYESEHGGTQQLADFCDALEAAVDALWKKV